MIKARLWRRRACPISIGQSIQTQTGISNGNITNKGFDARIGSNTDSFSDVFGQDGQGNYYVKKADSPRLGIIPIAQDSTGNWPLSGNATMSMQGYVLVYIGDTTKPPNYPAYSGGGSRLTIYLTPVNAPLPDSWGPCSAITRPPIPAPSSTASLRDPIRFRREVRQRKGSVRKCRKFNRSCLQCD